MKTAAATALKEEAKMKGKEEEDIAAHLMLEEQNIKRKEDNKKKAAADTASKEETKRTANSPTADALDEEVREGNDDNQQKEGMKDNVSHSNINNHPRELNSGAGAKEDDMGKMEEDPLPRKKKSRESNKRERDRKNKKRREVTPHTQSPLPQYLRKVDSWQPVEQQTKLQPRL